MRLLLMTKIIVIISQSYWFWKNVLVRKEEPNCLPNRLFLLLPCSDSLMSILFSDFHKDETHACCFKNNCQQLFLVFQSNYFEFQFQVFHNFFIIRAFVASVSCNAWFTFWIGLNFSKYVFITAANDNQTVCIKSVLIKLKRFAR